MRKTTPGVLLGALIASGTLLIVPAQAQDAAPEAPVLEVPAADAPEVEAPVVIEPADQALLDPPGLDAPPDPPADAPVAADVPVTPDVLVTPDTPPTVEAPVAGVAPSAGVATPALSTVPVGSWLTVKGDVQRTGWRPINMTLPMNLLWRHTTEGDPVSVTSPVVVGEEGARRIYFSSGAVVYCLNGETGEQIWKSAVLTRPITAPISLLSGGETGDMILAITSNGRMSALRTSDGGQVWEADARSPVQAAAPVLVNTARGERIVVGIALGRLLAFTRDGAIDPNWEVKLGQLGAAPTSTPAVTADGSFMFLTTQDQKIYCVDVKRGTIAYTVPLSTAALSSPMVLGEQVVVAAGQVVTGLKIRTGEPIWRVDTAGQRITASPSGAFNRENQPVVYVGARNGVFHAIDATRGRVLWKTNLGESITGSATVANNAVLVGTSRGVLYALKPEDGSILWQFRLRTERTIAARPTAGMGRRGGDGEGSGRFNGGAARTGRTGAFGATTSVTRTYEVTAAPAVLGNQAYVLGENASLYAFGPSTFDAAPPRVVEPSLSVPAREGGLYTALVNATRPLIVPGKAPVYFAAQLEDTGSGIDPNSIRVTANGEELPKDRAVFQMASSILTVTLNQPREGNVAVNLPDGVYTIGVTARDYAGNPLSYTGNVTIDNSVPPPTQEVPRGRDRRGNRGGQGGWPGGGGQGGWPGGGGQGGEGDWPGGGGQGGGGGFGPPGGGGGRTSPAADAP
jgi:outer membrane protein assembly factor BamB